MTDNKLAEGGGREMIGRKVVAPFKNRWFTAKIVAERDKETIIKRKNPIKEYAVEFYDGEIVWIDSRAIEMKGTK